MLEDDIRNVGENFEVLSLVRTWDNEKAPSEMSKLNPQVSIKAEQVQSLRDKLIAIEKDVSSVEVKCTKSE